MIAEHENYDARALLALPKIAAGSTAEKGLLSWSRPFLIDSVRSKGVDVEVVRGLPALTSHEGYAGNVVRPHYRNEDQEVTIHDRGEVALREYGVLRNIIANTALDQYVSMLNPTAVRSLLRDKHRTIETILRPAGAFDRNSHLFDPQQPSDRVAIESLRGDRIVAKPNQGSRSQGVVVDAHKSVEVYLSEVQVPYLVEEKIDFSHPFPATVRGYDEVQQARLEQANRDGVNKELRLFYFGDNQWESIARVAKPDETNFSSDTWLYIDDATVPEEVYISAQDVVRKLASETGHSEMNVAVDFVYGSTPSSPEPHWQVMELNGAEPQLVQISQHPEIGKRQHDKLAAQIARIALITKT